MSRISLIVPTKNRPVEIVRCVQSALDHDAALDEIIVVDQSSQPYVLPNDPRIVHLYRPDLAGLTAARNAGIERATGEIVIFMDDDCTFKNDVAAAVRDAFAADPGAIGAQPDVRDPDYTPPPISQRVFEHGFFDAHTMQARGAATLRRMSGASMAFRASLFAKERFDESLTGYGYGEDWDFSLRAKRWGRLIPANGARVEHRPSASNRFDRRRSFVMRWVNYHHIYAKLRRDTGPIDRLWYWWWRLGETLQWLRFGYGLPRSE